MLKRILLKLSGEALAGDKKTGFDLDVCKDMAKQVKSVVDKGIQVAIVIGGGNFWRGRTGTEIERTKADSIGMLATVMNCVYVSEVFRTADINTSIYNSFECGDIAGLFVKDRVLDDLNNGKVVFLSGGTGHPYFSTDTATVLRAIEIEADSILLAKAIDGVYDSDPLKNSNAKKFDSITLKEVVQKGLQVVDMTASVLAMENKMPMLVFKLNEKDSIINAISDKFNGTKVNV